MTTSTNPATQVRGYCPMGCGQTLFLGDGGYISCSSIKCPAPAAVSDILADDETHHVVELRATDFTIKHPLAERLHGDLFDCTLDEHLTSLTGPPTVPGRYQVRSLGAGDTWTWHRI